MEFRLLGAIDVVGQDGGHAPVGGERQRALLAALLLESGRVLTRDRLVDAVWENPPPSAAHAIEVYVSKLRRALADVGAPSAIVTQRSGYVADVPDDSIDLNRFRTLATSARADAAKGRLREAFVAMSDALGLWRGVALGCLEACPIAAERRMLEDERLAVLEERADIGLRLGLDDELLAELRALTREHPERERLWQELMLALYRAGRQGEALDVFLEARRQLSALYGIEPGAAMRDLQRRVLEQDPSLDLPSSGAGAISLPASPSSFVGRALELEEAAELVSSGSTRLLTVIGPGGIGKTRFAIELAHRLADRFGDGVTWVGLDALDDPARVLTEVAAACGAGGSAGEPLAALARDLRDERALLVLDCFENVLEAATDVHRLLERVPGLCVITTSRERLGLSGEQLYWLPPLTPEDAAVLFLARTRSVSRSTPPSDEVVAEVCERLDRIPLAIELVASQVDVRTRDELFATLERTLDVDGRRDPPARHRTLRAALDWSYALLDEDGRRALRGLSIFEGGFTVEAAEGVVATSREEIERLVGKSLVTTRPDADRYRLLDTVRSYGIELLQQRGDLDRLSGRHAAWFADLARSIEPETYMSQTGAGLAVFTVELPNFRLAHRSAVEREDGRTAAAIVRSLAPFLYPSVSSVDGRRLSRATLSLAGSDPIDRGHVLYYDACISMDMGLADETRAALDEAEAVFAEHDDQRGLSMVENLRCFHGATIGEYVEAAAAGERAVAHARRAGARALEDIAHDHLAYALLGLGAAGPVRDEAALARSLELLRAAVARAEACGHPYALAAAHGNVASPLLELGELEEAAVHVRRALELHREHEFAQPYALIEAAEIAGRLGDHEIAIRLLVPCLDDLSASSVALQSYSARQVDAIYAAARTSLGEEGVAAAERLGRAMTVEEALELALALELPAATHPASPG